MARHRATKAEKQDRIETLARMIVAGANAVELHRFIKTTWGLSSCIATKYVNESRAYVAEISDVDRREFVSAKISQLESIAREAAKAGQHNNAIGALRLMSEMVGVLGNK